jgi:succinyl-CoA synthetase beta subunit
MRNQMNAKEIILPQGLVLLEHEGKAVFRSHGIPIPKGVTVRKGEDAREKARDLTLPLMLKAQVPIGGRGEAGGIRKLEKDLALEVDQLLGGQINGYPVEAVLIEEKAPARKERYLSVMIDESDIVLLLGRSGGVDVESTVATDRSNLVRLPVPHEGQPSSDQLRKALERIGIPRDLHAEYQRIVRALIGLLQANDAKLAEINPLAELDDGRLLALDARIVIDSGALFRQPAFAAIAKERAKHDTVQARLEELQIQYVPIGGSIGLLSTGAGVGVAIMDWVAREGQRLSAFVDLDYAIMAGHAEPAMRFMVDMFDGDPSVRAIIVNFTTCGLRLDLIAKALANVLKSRPPHAAPALIHLQGNRAAAAHDILRSAGLQVGAALGEVVRAASRIATESAP